MKMPGRLRLRGKKKRTKERNLVSDDSGHSERIPMFNLGRVNRRAHHFQSKEYVILQKVGQVMANSLPPEAIEKASERPTMAIRTWLRSQCENYGTWREEEELAHILNGANPASLIGQKDPDPETSESSDDDTFSIMDATKKKPRRTICQTLQWKHQWKLQLIHPSLFLRKGGSFCLHQKVLPQNPVVLSTTAPKKHIQKIKLSIGSFQ